MILDPSATSGGDTAESLALYYARRATEYEQVYDKPERQEELHKLRMLASTAFAGLDVLELACGTGYWTQFIAQSAHSIVATDINSEVLNIAQSKARGPCPVQFKQENAFHLQRGPEPYSAVFAGFWWSHIPRKQVRPFLHRLNAVASEGAPVVLIDNRFVAGSSTPLSRTNHEGDTYQVRRLSDGTEYEVLKNFPTESELRESVANIGEDVQIALWRYYWILQYKTKPVPPCSA